MSRIGQTLVGCALALAALAPPAGAAFVEVGRIDSGTGSDSLALSPAADALYVTGLSSTSDGGSISHFAADGSKVAGWTFSGRVTNMAVEANGNVLAANAFEHQIVRYSPTGSELGRIGSEGSGAGKFHGPTDVAVGPGGDIFILDSGNNRIERMGADGSFVSQFRDVVPTASDGFTHATFLSMDAAGGMYVTDGGNENVRKLDSSGALATTFGTSGDGKLSRPGGTAVDGAGNLYVADFGNRRIAVFKPDGTFALAIGQGIVDDTSDVAVDTAGNVYILDHVNTDVVKLADDVTPPRITLSGPAKQSIKSGKVKVTVASSEAAKLAATGGKLSPARGTVAAGKTATLALKISAAAKAAVKKGKKVVVTVTVTATDAAGNPVSAKKKIRLKR